MTRGCLEEEEGITYYIRYCPEDDSYLQGTDCDGCRATWLTTRATWRQMSARRRRSGRSPRAHTTWPQ